ncbi:CsbD family protein [Arenimonas metalli]|uniref:CsbD-like domain-containing protein n=1 Tax=Arenimonas metalli CF5-1 TaxID=1384056 RepID=A0A091BBA3_9GAMM|nr:CsbD family protein [Arenimonas metalli]KFN48114.1 hypothetical protein N787_06650 [Arenimonas metalli CF5-1]
MDKNTKGGIGHQVKGSLKEATGKVTGNQSKELAGKVEKNLGKAQRKVGEATTEIKNAVKKDD